MLLVTVSVNCQSRLYSGSHDTIDIWDAATGKYNLLGKITHSYGSVHALAVTEQYIIAGMMRLLLTYDIRFCYHITVTVFLVLNDVSYLQVVKVELVRRTLASSP